MKHKKDIFHIYWGTAGNAGLYMDEIYQTLKKAGYEQKTFVSYYYPFDYGEKVFFKRTEMEHCKYTGTKRRIMQAFELLIALIKILLAGKKDKPQIINYSYVSNGNSVIFWFLKRLKKSSQCKLIITCHDVEPFAKDRVAYEKELAIKKKIYSLADYYLVHNANSREALISLFQVNPDRILEHLFPIMDLTKLEGSQGEVDSLYDFLFIGHLRREKGIEFLLNSWPKFHRQQPMANLCIAGNPSYYKEYIDSHQKDCEENGIIFKMGFLSDNEYIALVKSASCIIFPYLSGTNSGVISTVISLNKCVITSDIEMFANNPLIPREYMFAAGDEGSFLGLLQKAYNHKNNSVGMDLVNNYRKIFNSQVELVYSSIIKK